MSDEKKFKVVLTDHDWPDLNVEYNIFSSLGVKIIAAYCKTGDEVIAVAKDADAIIAEHAPLTNKVIKSLEKCRLMSMNMAGYKNVDIDAATTAGIMVCKLPGLLL